MSTNLLEQIQENLQYPPLQKIDPNTQEVKADDSTPNEHRFSQAAIPAILTGLYKYVSTYEGAETILRGDNSTNWVSRIFADTKSEVVQKVASYSFMPVGDTESSMNNIAREAVRLTREDLKENATRMDVKKFLFAQRDTILLYLPEALHMGQLLHDTTVDDNTNKMEGPVSSLMHKLGSAFSKPSDEAEVKSN